VGDPESPSPIPPYRPRSSRSRRQGDEVLFDSAIPAQLLGSSYLPVGGTDHPHNPAGDDRRPPDVGPKQGRGTGDGFCLAPSLGTDNSGHPGPPSRKCAGTGPPTPDSDGVRDAADTSVLTRLRELHPQAEGPNLEHPLPEERPDIATSWASDQLLAMEAVV